MQVRAASSIRRSTVAAFVSASLMVLIGGGTVQAEQVAHADLPEAVTLPLPGATLATDPGDPASAALGPAVVAPTCATADEDACERLLRICDQMNGQMTDTDDSARACILSLN